jgi:hypothetical protein
MRLRVARQVSRARSALPPAAITGALRAMTPVKRQLRLSYVPTGHSCPCLHPSVPHQARRPFCDGIFSKDRSGLGCYIVTRGCVVAGPIAPKKPLVRTVRPDRAGSKLWWRGVSCSPPYCPASRFARAQAESVQLPCARAPAGSGLTVTAAETSCTQIAKS